MIKYFKDGFWKSNYPVDKMSIFVKKIKGYSLHLIFGDINIPNFIEIAVIDTGIGMSQEMINRQNN